MPPPELDQNLTLVDLAIGPETIILKHPKYAKTLTKSEILSLISSRRLFNVRKTDKLFTDENFTNRLVVHWMLLRAVPAVVHAPDPQTLDGRCVRDNSLRSEIR